MSYNINQWHGHPAKEDSSNIRILPEVVVVLILLVSVHDNLLFKFLFVCFSNQAEMKIFVYVIKFKCQSEAFCRSLFRLLSQVLHPFDRKFWSPESDVKSTFLL